MDGGCCRLGGPACFGSGLGQGWLFDGSIPGYFLRVLGVL